MKTITTSSARNLRTRISTLAVLLLPLAGVAQPATNRVLSLDGNGDYMSVPSAAELQTPTEITVEFWMNPHPRNQYPVFLSKSDGQSGNSARSYEFDWPSNGVLGVQFFWQIQAGKPDFHAILTPLTSNQWTHVAAVFSSQRGVFQVFINGALAGQESDLIGRTLRQTSLPLVLGWVSPFAYTYASGGMDEVRIWNKARTAEEIYRDRFCRLAGNEPNLVAYWTFDDGTATDLTGRGHDGTFAGDAHAQAILGNDAVHAGACGPELTNSVLSLPTFGDYVSAPDPNSLAFTSNFTLEAWINPTDPNAAAVIAKNRFVGGTGYRLGLSFLKPELGVVVGPSGHGTQVLITSPEPLSTGTWHHICGTYDGSVFRLYVDGALKASTNATLQMQFSSLPIYLGQEGLPGDLRTFLGRMDEVRIWNKARTSEEIYRDRYCRLTGGESNLVAYYDFENGAATDLTGHGHDGTLSGSALIVPLAGRDDVHAGLCGQILPRYFINDLTPGGGIVMPEPFLSSFPMNSTVTLTATPAGGWTFLDWKGNTQGTAPVTTLQMTRDKMVAARFGTPVTVAPSGGGTASLMPSSALYPYGTSVRAVAQPQTGSYFTGWSGSAGGDLNPLTLVVRDGNPVLFASFASLPAGRFALTVIPDGNGSVSVAPRANTFTNGQTVTLRAMPDAGQEFLGWSGDASGPGVTNVITMTQSKVITASFTKRPRLGIQSLESDGLLLTMTGEFSRVYSVLTSTDLTNWVPLLTLTNAYGMAQTFAPSSTNQWQFYRAVAP